MSFVLMLKMTFSLNVSFFANQEVTKMYQDKGKKNTRKPNTKIRLWVSNKIRLEDSY